MSASEPRIGVLPNHMKLGVSPGDIPLGDLHWPLGTPPDIEGRHLRDLRAEDHLLIFPRKTVHLRPGFGTRARVSIMVMEPPAIHGQHLRALRLSYRRFFRVLTYDDALLAAIPNGAFFAHGGTWVPEWRDLDLTKTRMTSLIASAKRSQHGHRLRHTVADWARGEGLDVDVMGSGYRRFAYKSEGLAPYRYSVVIENGRARNYFTEKLLDAILCRTVPIYWGCPNIADFFDTSGMILCESREDIERAVRTASEAEYAEKAPHLEALRPVADRYSDVLHRAAVIVRDAARAAG